MTTSKTLIDTAVAAGTMGGAGEALSARLGNEFRAAGFQFGLMEDGKFGPLGAESAAMLAAVAGAYRAAWAKARGLQGAALAVAEAGGVKHIDIPEGQKAACDEASRKVRTAWQNFRDAALTSAGYTVRVAVTKGATTKGAKGEKPAAGVAGIPGTIGGVLELLTQKGVDGVLVSVAEWLITTQAGKATLAKLAKDSPDFAAWSDGKDRNGWAKGNEPKPAAKPAKPAK